jgi:uncharacterized integral membrane protein
MGFLKTLFWVVLTVVVVVFLMHNWTPTQIALFGDLVWQTKLPVPLVLAFLLGFVPLYVWHRITRWRDRRRLHAAAAAPLPVAPAATAMEPALAAPAPLTTLSDPTRQDA